MTFVTAIESIDVEKGTAVIERVTEKSQEKIEVQMPAVLTCQKDVAAVPYVSLPALLKSMDMEIEQWGYDNVVVYDRSKLGLKGSPTKVHKSFTPELKSDGRDLG